MQAETTNKKATIESEANPRERVVTVLRKECTHDPSHLLSEAGSPMWEWRIKYWGRVCP